SLVTLVETVTVRVWGPVEPPVPPVGVFGGNVVAVVDELPGTVRVRGSQSFGCDVTTSGNIAANGPGATLTPPGPVMVNPWYVPNCVIRTSISPRPIGASTPWPVTGPVGPCANVAVHDPAFWGWLVKYN